VQAERGDARLEAPREDRERASRHRFVPSMPARALGSHHRGGESRCHRPPFA
jgi:hypothetical protein